MRWAIYCRVSTEGQEREGTSLETQKQACLQKAQQVGAEVEEKHILLEVQSGLTLDRPKLYTLRDWAKDKDVDGVLVYSTDRLSRDPVHLLLLVEEFDKAKFQLIFVADPLDNSLEGQLLTFVRGWSNKVEAVKIAERTMRGKRERAKQGKLPAGSHARLYGYHYIKGKGEGRGIRFPNEEQANWVREMFKWLVGEGLSLNHIVYRLRDLSVPTPSGSGYWTRSTVYKILTNPAYCGKTYAFTRTYVEPKYRLKDDTKRRNTGLMWRPREDWIEIPNATPPIISGEMFEAAQRQLQRNRELSLRSAKHEYLLHGHIYCARCKRSYWGYAKGWERGSKCYERRYYHCSGNLRIVTPDRCNNRNYSADYLEEVVWEKVESVLLEPGLLIAELEKRQRTGDDIQRLESELQRIEHSLRELVLRERKLVKDSLYDNIDGETFRALHRELLAERKRLEEDKRQKEWESEVARQSLIDVQGIRHFCELAARNIKTFGFQEKRLALEALQIKVWLDGFHIDIKGVIPVKREVVSMQS